jgi:type I restriction enzyme S subunit
MPTRFEQDKIESFISLLDRRIEVQSGLIEDLKNIKKYLMEQLFCQPKEKSPRLRLGGMSDEWKKVRLCDVVERVTTRNKTNECTRVLTIAAQYGLIDQQEFFNKQIASSDLTTYYLLHRGDFAYNKSYSSDYPWGAVKRLDNYEEGVLSSLYICFCPNKNIDSDFLRHYFESTKWYRGISEISGEGARNHGLLNMSVEDFFNTTHRIPSIEEQRCISHLLNAFAHKIINEESILDKLRRQKSYLLNNMFI